MKTFNQVRGIVTAISMLFITIYGIILKLISMKMVFVNYGSLNPKLGNFLIEGGFWFLIVASIYLQIKMASYARFVSQRNQKMSMRKAEKGQLRTSISHTGKFNFQERTFGDSQILQPGIDIRNKSDREELVMQDGRPERAQSTVQSAEDLISRKWDEDENTAKA